MENNANGTHNVSKMKHNTHKMINSKQQTSDLEYQTESSNYIMNINKNKDSK